MTDTFKSRDYQYKRVSEGSVVGRLTVKSVAGRSKNGSKMWHCVCTCGNTKDVISSSLNSGLVQSCGCRYDEIKGTQKIAHGMSGTPTYQTWESMKQRCTNPNESFYHCYGGRGISICERWLNSFENFYADMGEKPAKHSIERIDVNGDYEPRNCKWATASEQAFNIRITKANKSGRTGVYHDTQTGKWVAAITHNHTQYHLGSFADIQTATRVREQAEFKYFGFIKE